jgi:hypothetical protein
MERSVSCLERNDVQILNLKKKENKKKVAEEKETK